MAAAVSMDEQPQARLGNAEGTMRCSSQRPSCTSSPRTPRATRSSLRSTRTSNPRARPPSNNEHAPLRKERILPPRVHKVPSPSAATKTRCWSKHEQEEETRRTHRTSSDSRPAACSTRPRSTQPTYLSRAARAPCQRYDRIVGRKNTSKNR